MDHGDTVLQRVQRRFETDIDALQLHPALVRLIDAGQHLHEGRLSGAVLTHQGVHASASQPERNVIEGDDTRKLLSHALGGEQEFGVRHRTALSHGSHCRWVDDHTILRFQQQRGMRGKPRMPGIIGQFFATKS